jgi:hypothetical protein
LAAARVSANNRPPAHADGRPLQAPCARPDAERRRGRFHGTSDCAGAAARPGLGLAATLGILVYDLRNSEIYDYAIQRAQQLETELQIAPSGDAAPGGLFSDRPSGTIRLFGVTANRDRGFALVYSAALGGWTYLTVWGAQRAAHLGHARVIGAAIGLAAALLVLRELIRIQIR